MKNFLLLLFFTPLFGRAQTTHTVAPKETLYSLGRQYNIHPKELAAYNNISIETGLTIGQVIKIPPKGNVPPVKTAPPPKTEVVTKKTETAYTTGTVPFYHKVEKKETLYHVSKVYNTTVDNIKKWNNLTSDGVSEGTNLIVGYKAGKVSEPVTTVKTEVENVPVKPVVTETEKPAPAKPVITETKPVIQATTVVKEEPNKITGKSFSGGYFKNVYNEQVSGKKEVKEENGTAAVFKSTSGWEDGKYYCLHNTAPSGSIIKITNKATQKTVYAKVLDVIPDLKQNSGILLRLSNAAADELGAGENNFETIINY